MAAVLQGNKLSQFLPRPFGVRLRRPRRDRERGVLVDPLSRSPRGPPLRRLGQAVVLAPHFVKVPRRLRVLRLVGVWIELELPAATVVRELRSGIGGARGVSPADVLPMAISSWSSDWVATAALQNFVR
jgi:hypothetical protein